MTEPTSEPKSVMDQKEQDRLTKDVGRAMVRVAGQHWQKIRAEYRSAGRHVEVDLTITAHDGQEHVIRPPGEVVSGLGRMRGGMYRPGRGTWLSAVYEIEPPGTFAVEFEPDAEPTWRRVPPPIGFLDELRFFPRSDDFIPDWLRARAGMPPAVSAETQAAHTPPRGFPAPTGTTPPAAGSPAQPSTGPQAQTPPGSPAVPASGSPGQPGPVPPAGPPQPGSGTPGPARPGVPVGGQPAYRPGPIPPGGVPAGGRPVPPSGPGAPHGHPAPMPAGQPPAGPWRGPGPTPPAGPRPPMPPRTPGNPPRP